MFPLPLLRYCKWSSLLALSLSSCAIESIPLQSASEAYLGKQDTPAEIHGSIQSIAFTEIGLPESSDLAHSRVFCPSWDNVISRKVKAQDLSVATDVGVYEFKQPIISEYGPLHEGTAVRLLTNDKGFLALPE